MFWVQSPRPASGQSADQTGLTCGLKAAVGPPICKRFSLCLFSTVSPSTISCFCIELHLHRAKFKSLFIWQSPLRWPPESQGRMRPQSVSPVLAWTRVLSTHLTNISHVSIASVTPSGCLSPQAGGLLAIWYQLRGRLSCLLKARGGSVPSVGDRPGLDVD